MAADQDPVLYEKRGHIGIFTLNRPKAMNAVNRQLSECFEALLETFEADSDVWVGLICSSHLKVFCAGADLKSVSRGENVATEKGGFAGLVKLERTKPLIAVVEGAALAGGCEIVLACDLVVASTQSQFGVPEVKRSLIAAAGGLVRLPRKLPYVVAMECVLTGDPISAERAERYGFINQLVAPGKALEAAITLAGRCDTTSRCDIWPHTQMRNTQT